MATRIVCNNSFCKHNHKNWCSKEKIELVVEGRDFMMCLDSLDKKKKKG